ncbi:MAG: glutaminyl-peptide cyclotransferase, partial [Bacteroidota bacterium]
LFLLSLLSPLSIRSLCSLPSLVSLSWILNPETLVEEGYIQTVTNKSIFNKANELEYVDGKIYANVWQKESMMIIDAKSGAIEGVINFGGLKNRVKKHDNLDVLNGVAYHPERETFFVTGKNWDKLFEVRIKKKVDGDL